ncbi:MAG: hypothetical protein ACLQFX_11020, partial [Acidimicrobiales bacterium]
EWLPRYVVWDAAENTLPMALAIARAESFWELPLIGRFFQPPGAGNGVHKIGVPSSSVTPSAPGAGHRSA